MSSPLVSVSVLGRLWFQRSAGNTYNTATITLHFASGAQYTIELPKAYGYGDYYMQRAADKIEDLGYMPDRIHYPNGAKEPAWQYFRDRSVPFLYQSVNVSRQKDL